jgi:hypothetical protein
MANLENVNNEVKLKRQTSKDFYTSIYKTPSQPIDTTSRPSPRQLVPNDSGKIFFITGALQANLPPAAEAGAGWNAEFILSAAPAVAPGYVISSSDTNNIHGNITTDASNIMSEGTGKDVVTFINGEATTGDRVKLQCDGTNFYVQGFVSASAGITLA